MLNIHCFHTDPRSNKDSAAAAAAMGPKPPGFTLRAACVASFLLRVKSALRQRVWEGQDKREVPVLHDES